MGGTSVWDGGGRLKGEGAFFSIGLNELCGLRHIHAVGILPDFVML